MIVCEYCVRAQIDRRKEWKKPTNFCYFFFRWNWTRKANGKVYWSANENGKCRWQKEKLGREQTFVLAAAFLVRIASSVPVKFDSRAGKATKANERKSKTRLDSDENRFLTRDSKLRKSAAAFKKTSRRRLNPLPTHPLRFIAQNNKIARKISTQIALHDARRSTIYEPNRKCVFLIFFPPFPPFSFISSILRRSARRPQPLPFWFSFRMSW